MTLASIEQEVVHLPRFVNEMLDIQINSDDPYIKTDFLLFSQ